MREVIGEVPPTVPDCANVLFADPVDHDHDHFDSDHDHDHDDHADGETGHDDHADGEHDHADGEHAHEDDHGDEGVEVSGVDEDSGAGSAACSSLLLLAVLAVVRVWYN